MEQKPKRKFAAGIMASIAAGLASIWILTPAVPEMFDKYALPVIAIFASIVGYLLGVKEDVRRVQVQETLKQVEEKAESHPEKIRFAWDLARLKLEAYFDRNLRQVNMIFYVAICVMLVGFTFVLWGIRFSISNPQQIEVTKWSFISGIITQFIGVTFMVIYRSTMAQANTFMSVLERINTVGMAVQVLDSMEHASSELKNQTRAEIISLLLAKKASAPAKRRHISPAPIQD